MTPVIIGDATLYLGDCREILPTLPKADLCVADPPYGIGESNAKAASRGKLAAAIDYGHFDWDNEPASDEAITATIAAAQYCILWGGNYFNVPPSKGWLIWDKINGANDFADGEMAWTNLPTAVRIFRHMWNGMLRDSEKDTPRVHPTQKAVALMQWCIDKSKIPAGSKVVDPFMGSGTVGIACVKMGMKYIGIEREERYFDIAVKRITTEYSQLRLDL